MPTTRTEHEDVLGAVGLPIGILAMVLALIPVAGIHLFWIPGSAALVLGLIGLLRARKNAGYRHLSIAALVLGLVSFAVVGGWFLLSGLWMLFVGLFAHRY